jgi:hypothetical protein
MDGPPKMRAAGARQSTDRGNISLDHSHTHPTSVELQAQARRAREAYAKAFARDAHPRPWGGDSFSDKTLADIADARNAAAIRYLSGSRWLTQMGATP